MLMLVLLMTPTVSLCSLYWVITNMQAELHDEIFHQQFERLDILSKHRKSDLDEFIAWQYHEWDELGINVHLNDNRMGFETSDSTEIYLMERDGGGNCYARSKSRFEAYQDHQFRECSTGVIETIENGAFRGFSEDYRDIKVLSVGRTIKAAVDEDWRSGQIDIALMTEVDEREVLEVVIPVERKLNRVAMLAALFILLSSMVTLTTLYFTDRKREKAEKERDKALKDLRNAVAVFSD